jgi:hypothetical protein
MRRVAVLVALLALAGCDGTDGCPGERIEMTPYSGQPVTGTAVTCDGEALRNWAACQPDARAVVSHTPFGCGDNVRIIIGPAFVGNEPVLWLFPDAPEHLAVAHLEVKYASDVDGETAETPALIDGTVAIEQWSRTGRNTGTFRFELEVGTISGQYDAE